MATYKKLSEYEINVAPNSGDLIPTLVSNGDGTYQNTLIQYSSLKGVAGTNGTNGQGVSTGGSIGQVLKKNSATNYDTSWGALDKAAVGLGNADNTSDVNKPVSTAVTAAIVAAVASAVAQAKQEAYPVGSMYFNADVATNPATLLGFGTWVAYAEGRVPVGKAVSGTFSTAGSTGGAETHTLSQAEMPWHTHGQYVTANSGPAVRKDYVADAASGAYDQGQQTQPAGGGGAHNNLQPYVTVYIWRRTT